MCMPGAEGRSNTWWCVKLFKTSNNEDDAVSVLRYRVVEKSPFRVVMRATEATKQDDQYDLSLVATAGKDTYLMSLGSGSAADGKFFTWNTEKEWGVDCAAGLDPVLVIATVMCAGPNGDPSALRGGSGG